MIEPGEPLVPGPRKPGDPDVPLAPRRPDTHDTVPAAIALFVAAAGGSISIAAMFGVGLVLPGLAQLPGVAILLVYAYRGQRYTLAKVTWIASGIVFLVNAACTGLVILSLGGW